MSNPISNVEDISKDISKEPELEIDDNLDANAPPPVLEVDATDESAEQGASPQQTSRGRMGLLALVLGILLIGSIAINLQQARVTAALNAETQQLQAAAIEASEVIELEVARADAAESTLSEIGSAVDQVNDRIESLQQALGELRSVTIR